MKEIKKEIDRLKKLVELQEKVLKQIEEEK